MDLHYGGLPERLCNGVAHPFPTITRLIIIVSILLVVAMAACGPMGGGSTAPLTDFGDRRRLVGFVDHVFVGRVVGMVGARQADPPDVRKPDDPGEPLTAVDVTENIKGSLPGRVTVIGPRLEPGKEYVFSTNPHPEGPWQIVVSRYGFVPVGDERQRAELREEFRRAYEEEIPYNPGAP